MITYTHTHILAHPPPLRQHHFNQMNVIDAIRLKPIAIINDDGADDGVGDGSDDDGNAMEIIIS